MVLFVNRIATVMPAFRRGLSGLTKHVAGRERTVGRETREAAETLPTGILRHSREKLSACCARPFNLDHPFDYLHPHGSSSVDFDALPA
jgi:hypothetical protein